VQVAAAFMGTPNVASAGLRSACAVGARRPASSVQLRRSDNKPRVWMAAGGEAEIVSPFAAGEGEGVGRGGANEMEFNVKNVDTVLDSVRPYLIADGGNCRVVEVDQVTGDVSLELEGACGTCPSSTVTLKMGIERALREQFGDRLGEVRQVTPGAPDVLTQEVVEGLLAPVMPAVKGLGGDVQIVGLDPQSGAVILKYKGPEKLTYGIELTLKDHPRINSVAFE